MQNPTRRTAKSLTTVILLTLVLAAPGSQAALDPLSEEHRGLLESLPEDPPPKSLIRGNHYLISNEDRPHLFHDVLVNRGGVLVGVGTDQLYVYAGWARSEVLIPMDFDKTVIDLHRIYMLLLTKAATPAKFIQLWHKRNEKTVRGWLDAYETDRALRKRLGYAFRVARQLVFARLKRLHHRYGSSKTPTFVSDQAQYDHLVSLVTTHRIHPRRGDLTKDGCLKAIGETIGKLGHTMDAIYLSNAEQYFGFDAIFRANFLGLPADGSSLVLRTSPRNKGKGYYRYESQLLSDFQGWLKRPNIKTIKQIRYHKKPGTLRDTFVFPGAPEQP